jgi:O-antigen/teichoic acid export membrane protein
MSADGLGETGRRAAAGAAVLIARGAVILVLGVGANVVLARLLTPRDFGLVALGTVLVVFGTFLADGGLGAGLIRRAAEPATRELRAVSAAQLALTAGVAVAAALVAIPIGRDGFIVATMVAALPIAMLKVPSVIVLERRLDYGPIAKVDLIEAAAFYAWALLTVALGAGVWGFATAVVARAVAGVVAMAWLGPVGLLRPRWSWADLRPVIGFGAKFQAAVVVGLVRDQSLNVGIAALAGTATLGIWNLGWRVLQIPFMVFGTLGRVAFPAMARVVSAGEDPRPAMERGGAAVAVLAAAVLTVLVGFAPALPVVLGPGWEDVPAILLWSGLAMIASFPVVLSSSPYLFASDAAGVVVRAAVVGAVTWLAVALSLASSIGAPAAGIGWCAGVLVQMPLLARAAAARSGAAVAHSVGLPIAIGLTGAAAGWVAADTAGGTVAAGILGAAVGEAILFGALLALRRRAIRDTRGLLSQALAGWTAREPVSGT